MDMKKRTIIFYARLNGINKSDNNSAVNGRLSVNSLIT